MSAISGILSVGTCMTTCQGCNEREVDMLMSPVQLWVNLNEAARIVKVSPSKLSRMAKNGEISFKRDPKDKRKVLLNIQELQQLFYPPESER
jgi:hypothetical protein